MTALAVRKKYPTKYAIANRLKMWTLLGTPFLPTDPRDDSSLCEVCACPRRLREDPCPIGCVCEEALSLAMRPLCVPRRHGVQERLRLRAVHQGYRGSAEAGPRHPRCQTPGRV